MRTNRLGVNGSGVVRTAGTVKSKISINVCHSGRGGMPILLGSSVSHRVGLSRLKSLTI